MNKKIQQQPPPSPTTPPSIVDLLIVGGGPTGLTVAAEALRHDLTVRLIDKKPKPIIIPPQKKNRDQYHHRSRALVIHARTMELLRALSDGRVANDIRASSIPLKRMNFYVGGGGGGGERGGKERETEEDDDDERDDFSSSTSSSSSHSSIIMRDLPWGDTEYPHYHIIPQYHVERILQKELPSNNDDDDDDIIEWNSSLNSLSAVNPSYVSSKISRADGSTDVIFSRYVVGCDGMRSLTRELCGASVRGERPEGGRMILVDGKTRDGMLASMPWEGHAFLGERGGVVLVFPLGGRRRRRRRGRDETSPAEDHLDDDDDESDDDDGTKYRFIVRAPPDFADRMEDIFGDDDAKLAYVNHILDDRMMGRRLSVYDMEWFATFDVSYGVADTYRIGRRVFLAGDAACHVRSPVDGGKDMNRGIQDAFNLVWKLAWVKKCGGGSMEEVERILDSYEKERRPLALSLVEATKVTTSMILTQNPLLYQLRKMALPFVTKLNVIKERMSRTVGMLNVTYRETKSPILPRSPSFFEKTDKMATHVMESFNNTMSKYKSAVVATTTAPPQQQRPLSSSSSSYVCTAGDRLPNLLTVDGRRLYHVVDRKRHSWVVVCGEETSIVINPKERFGLGGLGLVYAIVPEMGVDVVKSYVMLVRPDLYVAVVDDTFEAAWERMGMTVGESVQFNM